MSQKYRSNSKGFTIIEVMIVLAVAALIILIVLLAVPALQRSSRNTTIKNDASSVAAAVSNYETDNNGVMPTCISQSGATVTVGSGSSTSCTGENAKVQGSTQVTVITSSPGTVGSQYSGTSMQPGDVQVLFKNTCDGTANTRATAVFYLTENGGSNNTIQCIDT